MVDLSIFCLCFFFQAEDGIRDGHVTGVQTCALPICPGTVRRVWHLDRRAVRATGRGAAAGGGGLCGRDRGHGGPRHRSGPAGRDGRGGVRGLRRPDRPGRLRGDDAARTGLLGDEQLYHRADPADHGGPAPGAAGSCAGGPCGAGARGAGADAVDRRGAWPQRPSSPVPSPASCSRLSLSEPSSAGSVAGPWWVISELAAPDFATALPLGLAREPTTVMISTTKITISDNPVETSGTGTGWPSLRKPSSFSCRACRMSLAPMNSRIVDSPSER